MKNIINKFLKFQGLDFTKPIQAYIGKSQNLKLSLSPKILLYSLIVIILSNIKIFANTDNNNIVIGGSFDYPPYSFLDEDGRPAGFCVDLSLAISKVLNKEVQLKLVPWAEARNNLENRKIELIHDIVYTPDRTNIYSFSKPFHISSYAIFAKNGSPELKSISDLNNKKIILVNGDLGINYLKNNKINANIQYLDSYANAIHLLDVGDYQYAMMDELVGLYWIKETGAKQIDIRKLPLFKLKYCYASSIVDKESALEVDGALSILMQNGKFEEIYSKWMSKIDPWNESGWNFVLRYLWLFIAVIASIVFLFIWNFILKKKVSKKAEALKLANQSLKESEERFRALLDANPDLMFMFDRNRNFVDFHGGTDKLMYQPQMFIGKSIWEILPKNLADMTDVQLKNVFETGKMQVYEYQLFFNNKLRDYECRLVLSGDSYAISIVRDITERKYNEILLHRQNLELESQYEEYLQLNEMLRQTNEDLEYAKADAEEGERELASLMKNLPGMVYRCLNDENWTMKFVSDGVFKLTGYHPEELIDNTAISYNELIHPNDRELVNRIIQERLAVNKYYIVDYRIITKDGTIKFVWERGYQLEKPNEEQIVLQGFITDISERKYAEDMLQKQNQELEAQYEEYLQLNEMLRRTNTDLEIAKLKAEESDKLKTAFLQNMSHEIRTPLNGIIGYSSLLTNPNIALEEIEEYATIIQNSGNRLIEIVNNILDISKIETGQIEIQKQLVSLNSIMKDVFNFFLHSAEMKHISLNYNAYFENNNCLMQTDELRINQVLTNLIANALKFTKEGSINFGYELKDNMIVFYVRDTGIGIAPENIGIIFDRFSQIDLSMSRGFEGAGLGLAISKGLVHLLGGEIWVESVIDQGTTFYFSIPYDSQFQLDFNNDRIEKENIASGDNSSNKLKILIAEDDETSESLITLVVRKISRETINAHNGVEAVELCRNNPDTDLILMDVKMPIMNGIEATKMIREFNSEVIIIAQTAYAFNTEKEMILAAGCNEYISKPIEISKLIRLIEKHKTISNNN